MTSVHNKNNNQYINTAFQSQIGNQLSSRDRLRTNSLRRRLKVDTGNRMRDS